MSVQQTKKDVIARCIQSVTFFLRNFAKIKHPSAGILPLNPFKYQILALKSFRQHKFTIFKKCRQSGLSQISGAFALWFAMFFPNKTVLIVSKTDDDAMTYLREKVLFIFDHLPKWMRDYWNPRKRNDHEIVFPNGSSIKSLTSAPDCLRSNASSLNIIDESAFIREMSLMWAAGFPTLQHGGSAIIISTCNGVGNWHWGTWTDAEAGLNSFHPIDINWWDMDWAIEYVDSLSKHKTRIAPTDGIRKCTTPAEILKYGPYWSPWLEEQYRGLVEKGEGWKFKQEVLAQFIGSGNTIVDEAAIAKVGTTISKDFTVAKGSKVYVHPIKQDRQILEFSDPNDFKNDQGLWVWKQPFLGTASKKHNGKIIERGQSPHVYVGGVDIATGKGRDYNAMEIFDADTQEQVAELMIHCKPKKFMYMVDYIGRWYNNCLLVVERNNGGDQFIDDLKSDLLYQNIWRRITANDKPSLTGKKKQAKYSEYGYHTNQSSKPVLNRMLVTHIRESEGFKIYSPRLYKQLQIYVRKKDRAGRDTDKTEAEDGPGNHDDLVMATALAFIGLNDVGLLNSAGLMPFQATPDLNLVAPPINQQIVTSIDASKALNNMISADPHMIPPMALFGEIPQDLSAIAELQKFSNQLANSQPQRQIVVVKKHKL